MAVGLTIEQEALADAIRNCRLCPLGDLRNNAVPADLGSKADTPLLAIMGEAPGAQEDEVGMPFVGPAGRILAGLLDDAGLSRAEVLVLNRVRCRPPRNDIKAYPEAVHQCDMWTAAELAVYNPKVVVLMGGTSISAIFGSTAKVGETRGQARATSEDFEYGARYWMPTYHPASLLPYRRPENRGLVVADLMAARELLHA